MTTRLVTLITLRLVADRWAVAAPGDVWAEVDLPLHRWPSALDPNEPTHLPATGLAGSLRRHLEERGEDELGIKWLGAPAPERAEVMTGTVDYQPGKLWILGTRVESGTRHHRGRTAIEESRAAAKRNSLRKEEFMGAGRITVAMQHDGPPDDSLLSALVDWAPYLGRGRSGGMGAAYVEEVTAHGLDLDDLEHLGWWLNERSDWPDSAAPPEHTRHPTKSGHAKTVEPAFRWVVHEPIHIGVDSKQEPGKPAVTLAADGRALVPGESWKGVFRHRVRAILRMCGADDRSVREVTEALFGSAELGRGLLTFGDSYVPRSRVLGVQTHVAIDRFTGGALDGGLYALQSITRGTWLDLFITPAPGDLDAPVQNLMIHVARDLHHGLVGVGGGGGRGYGWVRFKDGHTPEAGPVDLHALLASIRGADR